MFTTRTRIGLISMLATTLLVGLPVASAQDEQDGPPRRERLKRNGPQKIQQRIEKLREEGVPEDDPRIVRLEKMLQFAEEEAPRDGMGRFGDGTGPRIGGPRHHSPQEIQAFVEKHPELRDLLEPPGDEGAPGRPKMMQRSQRQISEIMTAMDEGRNQLAGALIDRAKLQLAIGKKLREYHQAADDSDKTRARGELATLVRQQVQVGLAVEDLKLQGLRDRLAQQEARLAEDRTRQEELAAKKLEHLLSKKPGDKAGRFGPGRSGPQGEDELPGPEPDENP